MMTEIVPIVLALIVRGIWADDMCVCSLNRERHIYTKPDLDASLIGNLAMYQCRRLVYPINETWKAIMFDDQVGLLGFIVVNNNSMIQNCPTVKDTLTTANASQTTSKTATFATNQSLTPKTTHSTAYTTTHVPTFSPSITTIPEGHTELCPDHVMTDAHREGGFVGQFGEYCYELVNHATQWDNAHRHCTLTSSGDLLVITNEQVQNYIVRFLTLHSYVQAVWTGLNDKDKEGTWKWWNSGTPVMYTNFKGDFSFLSYHTHTLNDCVILKQGGEWTDAPCGQALILGTGFGEKHPYICQYDVISKPPSIFSVLGEQIAPALVG